SRSDGRQAGGHDGADHARRDDANAARAGVDGGRAGGAGNNGDGTAGGRGGRGINRGGRGTRQVQDGVAVDRDSGSADSLYVLARRFLRRRDVRAVDRDGGERVVVRRLLCARGRGAAAKAGDCGGQAGGDLTGAAAPDNQVDSSRRFGERV